jgi:hypothetical protein
MGLFFRIFHLVDVETDHVVQFKIIKDLLYLFFLVLYFFDFQSKIDHLVKFRVDLIANDLNVNYLLT